VIIRSSEERSSSTKKRLKRLVIAPISLRIVLLLII